MFVGVSLMLVFMMSYYIVEMIKQIPEPGFRFSLSIHGNVVYIVSFCKRVIQWNVVTDSVVMLEGYTGLSLLQLCPLGTTLV